MVVFDMSETCPPNGMSACARKCKSFTKTTLAIVCWLNFAIIFYLFIYRYIFVPASNGFYVFVRACVDEWLIWILNFYMRASIQPHRFKSKALKVGKRHTHSQIFVLKRQFIAVSIREKKRNLSKHEYILNETQKSNRIYRNVKKNVMSKLHERALEIYFIAPAQCARHIHIQAFHFNLIF